MRPLVKIEELIGAIQVYSGQSIFSFLATYDDGQGNPVFVDVQDFINADNCITLDIDYEIGHSAEKYFSPLVMKLIKVICDNESIDYNAFLFGELTTGEKSTILMKLLEDYGFGLLLYNRFKSKWKHIWVALNTAYNPLENYSMEEIRTPDITKQTDGNGTSDTSSGSGIFGFNSPESNPSSDVTGHQEDDMSRTETETGTETTNRSGNIGVTTSQQMLQSEFEVRKYDFYKMIYEDIDSILCLLSY